MTNSTATLASLPTFQARGKLVAPTGLDCLRCQLLGRRRLLCSRADTCKEIPHAGALGAVILVGLLAGLVGFIVSIL
jgi:hypothetical protein